MGTHRTRRQRTKMQRGKEWARESTLQKCTNAGYIKCIRHWLFETWKELADVSCHSLRISKISEKPLDVTKIKKTELLLKGEVYLFFVLAI